MTTNTTTEPALSGPEMTEVLTWPERVLREAPDHLLQRSAGDSRADRIRQDQLWNFCQARHAYPSLLELDTERKRRESTTPTEGN